MESAMMDYVDLNSMAVDLDAVGLVPEPLAREHLLLAVGLNGEALMTVTTGTVSSFALEEVRERTGRELILCRSEAAPLRRAIGYYYAELEARKTALLSSSSVEGGDVVRLLESLIRLAIAARASDIHIEPYETETLVRMRIDGVIQDHQTLPGTLHPALIARVKVLGELDITERRLPQDGHFRFQTEEGSVNIRVSVLPTVFGEKAVLRLLATEGQVEDYAGHFGMNQEIYRRFLPLLSVPNGMIYLTGPTGSGKSTTLYMILEYLAQGHVNISTIEDPVEKNLRRVNQTQVNVTAGLTFEKGLRAILRQDPDIIMVGETRDGETAEIAVRAAITGHLVFSTLHTNSAVSSVLRLADMGVEPYLIANSLGGVVAQRLLRKTCPDCGREVEATEEERSFWGASSVRRGAGCPGCSGTGYRGRIAIHELLTIDRPIRRMIAEGKNMESIEEYARKTQGLRTLKEQAAELVRRGVTTPEEALRIANYE